MFVPYLVFPGQTVNPPQTEPKLLTEFVMVYIWWLFCLYLISIVKIDRKQVKETDGEGSEKWPQVAGFIVCLVGFFLKLKWFSFLHTSTTSLILPQSKTRGNMVLLKNQQSCFITMQQNNIIFPSEQITVSCSSKLTDGHNCLMPPWLTGRERIPFPPTQHRLLLFT